MVSPRGGVPFTRGPFRRFPQTVASVPTVEIDNPPGNVPEIVVVLRDYALPILPRQIAGAITVAATGPQPNLDALTNFYAVLETWQPPDPLPTLSGKLAPSITAVPVNNPTPNADALNNLYATLGTWQPPDPLPTLPHYIVQGAVSQVASTGKWLPGVLTAWQPPDPLPTLSNKLPPAITAVAVNSPPAWYGVPHIVTLDDDPLPQRSPLLVQPAVASQPFVPNWLSSVLGSWAAPDPLPTLTAKLKPPSVDNPPPLKAGWLSTVIGAWVSPDPLPQTLRPIVQPFRLPYAPAWLPGVLAAWQPQDLPPTLPVHLVQPSVAISQPFASNWLPGVLGAWVPPDPQPILANKLPPQLIAVEVDNPPFSHPGRTASIQAQLAALWQPPDPLPWLSQRFVVQPFSSFTPFSALWLPGVLATWQPPDPQPTLAGKLPPVITAVEVDNPQPNLDALTNLHAILGAWVSPDPAPTLSRYAPPPTPAVGQVAFSAPWLSGVLAAWQPSDPLPTLPAKLVQPFVLPSLRQWLPLVLGTWQPLDPLPTLATKLPPSITAVEVDNPPFDQRAPVWKVGVLASWQPGDPQPILPTHIVQPFAASVPAPGQWLPLVLSAWQPPDPQPTLATLLNPSITAVEVDNPPTFTYGQQQWQPQPQLYDTIVLPTLPQFVVQPGTAPIPPPLIIPPAGGGKRRRFGIRPIWDRLPIPAPQPVTTPPVVKLPGVEKRAGQQTPTFSTKSQQQAPAPPPAHIFTPTVKPPSPTPVKTPRKHGISIAEQNLLLMIEALLDDDDDME